jgi:hypothetical protein
MPKVAIIWRGDLQGAENNWGNGGLSALRLMRGLSSAYNYLSIPNFIRNE